jgi:type II secretory pathway component GspD/PulD (secretin)
MKPTLLALLLMTAAAWAQEAPKSTQAIIDVKYADPNRLVDLLRQTFNANMRADSALHVIGVSGPPDLVAAVTAAIQKLDVPLSAEPDVELAVYLISGVAQGTATDDVPQELASTIK